MANELIACVFVVCVTLSIVYWWMVAPILVRRQIYKIHAIKDRFFWASLNGNIDWSYDGLFLLNSLFEADDISLSQMRLCYTQHEHKNSEKIGETATITENLDLSAREATMLIMIINSPLLYLMLRMLVLLKLRKLITGVWFDGETYWLLSAEY